MSCGTISSSHRATDRREQVRGVHQGIPFPARKPRSSVGRAAGRKRRSARARLLTTRANSRIFCLSAPRRRSTTMFGGFRRSLGLLLFTPVAVAIPVGLPLCREPRRVGRPACLLVLECRIFSRWTRPASASSRECMRATWNSTRSAASSRSFAATPAAIVAPIRRTRSIASKRATPFIEVWRAGCDGAARRVARHAQCEAERRRRGECSAAPRARDAGAPPARRKRPRPPLRSPSRATGRGGRPATSAAAGAADERRVDSCIRFADNRRIRSSAMPRSPTPASSPSRSRIATRAAAVAHTIARRRRGPSALDSLGPGATHNLPEYRRGSNNGVALVACKGAIGTVTPLLNSSRRQDGMQLIACRAPDICRSQMRTAWRIFASGVFGWIFLRQWNNLAHLP